MNIFFLIVSIILFLSKWHVSLLAAPVPVKKNVVVQKVTPVIKKQELEVVDIIVNAPIFKSVKFGIVRLDNLSHSDKSPTVKRVIKDLIICQLFVGGQIYRSYDEARALGCEYVLCIESNKDLSMDVLKPQDQSKLIWSWVCVSVAPRVVLSGFVPEDFLCHHEVSNKIYKFHYGAAGFFQNLFLTTSDDKQFQLLNKNNAKIKDDHIVLINHHGDFLKTWGSLNGGYFMGGTTTPDGKTVVFWGLNQDTGKNDLYQIDTLGKKMKNITPNWDGRHLIYPPIVSPSGLEVLLIMRTVDTIGIYVYSLIDNGIARLYSVDSRENAIIGASYSPKGDHIAFLETINHKKTIKILSRYEDKVVNLVDYRENTQGNGVDEKKETSFRENGGRVSYDSCAWSPYPGRWIAYVKQHKGVRYLVLYDIYRRQSFNLCQAYYIESIFFSQNGQVLSALIQHGKKSKKEIIFVSLESGIDGVRYQILPFVSIQHSIWFGIGEIE